MFDQRLLDKSLAGIGVQRRGKLRYQATGPNRALTWTLSFRLLGVYRWEITGGLIASHSKATPFARDCLAHFAGRSWATALSKHPEVASGIGLPISSLTGWGEWHSLTIKDFTAHDSASRIAFDVARYVLPFIGSIQNDTQYLDHLLADDPPMQWLHSQPLLRFAEAVKLLVDGGRDVAPAMQALERERAFAQGQLDDLALDTYAASVLRAADS